MTTTYNKTIVSQIPPDMNKIMMTNYYKEWFPLEVFQIWLEYGKASNFASREFSLTGEGYLFLRYTFDTINKFKQTLLLRRPSRIDMGPFSGILDVSEESEDYDDEILRSVMKMTINPSEPVPVSHVNKNDYKASSKSSIKESNEVGHDDRAIFQRELIFDIDIDDYNDVRTCCTDSDICQKCWKYMAMACEILHATLTTDLSFKHILWTFSGRRGIHAWVCDESVHDLGPGERWAIAKSIQLLNFAPGVVKNINLPERIKPDIQRALNIIEPQFVEVCIEDQGLLSTDEKIKMFLKLLPEGFIREEVSELFESCETGRERWEQFVEFMKDKNETQDRHLVLEIMLQFCYVRLDIQVTMPLKHQLKVPFSMHPKTRRISIPFDPTKVREFQLSTVPCVNSITIGCESDGAKATEIEIFKDSVAIFKKFAEGLRSARVAKRYPPVSDNKPDKYPLTDYEDTVTEMQLDKILELMENNERSKADGEKNSVEEIEAIVKQVCGNPDVVEPSRGQSVTPMEIAFD